MASTLKMQAVPVSSVSLKRLEDVIPDENSLSQTFNGDRTWDTLFLVAKQHKANEKVAMRQNSRKDVGYCAQSLSVCNERFKFFRPHFSVLRTKLLRFIYDHFRFLVGFCRRAASNESFNPKIYRRTP